MGRPSPEPLRAPLDIEFDYTRSLGPVLGRFMTALADRRILGVRGADGRVHAPPFEYDPVSSAGELTEVGPEGTVLSWSWMPEPLEGQPLAEPFAWALIRLDGADTAILHAVDAGSPSAMRTGLRVRPRWAASRVGSIRDIACFEPCDGSAPAAQERAAHRQVPAARGPDAPHGASAARRPGPAAATGAPAAAEPDPPIAGLTVTPIRLHYEHTASPWESAYLRGLAEGRLTGDTAAEELLGRPYVAEPLRAHDCAPVGDGAAVVIIASERRAPDLCGRPAWITGFAHRIDSGSLGAWDLLAVPSAAAAGRAAGVAAGRTVEVAELHAPFSHQEIMLREALGLGDGVAVNPSGGALCGNPMFAAGLARIGTAAQAIMSGRAGHTLGHTTSGPALQQNLVCVMEGR